MNVSLKKDCKWYKTEVYRLIRDEKGEISTVESTLEVYDKKYPSEVWIDKHGNMWDVRKFTKEEAKRYSKTLIDCNHCLDCDNCRSCLSCKWCTGCTNCVDCEKCANLTGQWHEKNMDSEGEWY